MPASRVTLCGGGLLRLRAPFSGMCVAISLVNLVKLALEPCSSVINVYFCSLLLYCSCHCVDLLLFPSQPNGGDILWHFFAAGLKQVKGRGCDHANLSFLFLRPLCAVHDTAKKHVRLVCHGCSVVLSTTAHTSQLVDYA